MLSKKKSEPELYSIGCLGKIVNFSETGDNRLIITLLGLCRFKIVNAVNNDKLYKEFIVDYSGFENDLDTSNISKTKIDTEKQILELEDKV